MLDPIGFISHGISPVILNHPAIGYNHLWKPPVMSSSFPHPQSSPMAPPWQMNSASNHDWNPRPGTEGFFGMADIFSDMI